MIRLWSIFFLVRIVYFSYIVIVVLGKHLYVKYCLEFLDLKVNFFNVSSNIITILLLLGGRISHSMLTIPIEIKELSSLTMKNDSL